MPKLRACGRPYRLGQGGHDENNYGEEIEIEGVWSDEY